MRDDRTASEGLKFTAGVAIITSQFGFRAKFRSRVQLVIAGDACATRVVTM